MEKLSFSTLQLIIESETNPIRFVKPEKHYFEHIPKEFEYGESDDFHKVYTELSDQFFWLVAEYGKPEPHRDKWVDIASHKEAKNQRKITQVELTNQSFLFYSFSSNLLYLSNTHHLKLMEKILTDNSTNKFWIKRILVDFEEFIRIIKSVDKIKFTAVNDLFSSDSKEFKALEDLTGTASPTSFTLEAKYDKSTILGFIRRLYQGKKDYQIKKLLVKGLDESGLETIYNVDTFTNHITINSSKNSEGVYDHDVVKSAILNKIAKDEE